jgi:hypothetical protein
MQKLLISPVFLPDTSISDNCFFLMVTYEVDLNSLIQFKAIVT